MANIKKKTKKTTVKQGCKNVTATTKNSVEVSQKIKNRITMTQYSTSGYIHQITEQQDLEEIFAQSCSKQYYSQ